MTGSSTAALSAQRTDFELPGAVGALHAAVWRSAEGEAASWIAVLCHGYGEHVLRYGWVAEQLVDAGAVVYAVDHRGHGRSVGEPVLVNDFDSVVDDVHLVVERARTHNPGLPVVLIGHSMGGMIAARYAQRFGDELAAVVLSGPVLGSWAAADAALAVDPIPDAPIDPSTLSRDDAVGAAYLADPLVWHGPFKRPTLKALTSMLATIAESGVVTSVPLQLQHGADDQLVPYPATAVGWSAIAPADAPVIVYPGARHEIFNETNKDDVIADTIAFARRHLAG